MSEEESGRHADQRTHGERIREHIGRRLEQLIALNARTKKADVPLQGPDERNHRGTNTGSDE